MQVRSGQDDGAELAGPGAVWILKSALLFLNILSGVVADRVPIKVGKKGPSC